MRSCIEFATSRRRTFRLLACLALFVASLIRYGANRDPSVSDANLGESWRLATSLAATGTFANPFATLNTGPSAGSRVLATLPRLLASP
jgi:hypothetical protein